MRFTYIVLIVLGIGAFACPLKALEHILVPPFFQPTLKKESLDESQRLAMQGHHYEQQYQSSKNFLALINAFNCYLRALTLAPSNTQAHYDLGMLYTDTLSYKVDNICHYSDQELRERAIMHLQQAQAINSPMVHYTLGLLLSAQGKKHAAKDHFIQAITMYDSHPARYQLAQLLRHDSDADTDQIQDLLITAAPHYQPAQELLSTLANFSGEQPAKKRRLNRA